ncbi:chitinase domain-containing protein 1 isoform X2 [Artibeus jamaicensis]|uniref:chitinase domain-containing protein 1 isoform X2 n=1 Tax=Artibeus jamaicensis TaxID=9417 RepID=UPI00235AC92B|nr:chitinase domain-containing protein 1 isoform X2 [Artibeus jamaicensis]
MVTTHCTPFQGHSAQRRSWGVKTRSDITGCRSSAASSGRTMMPWAEKQAPDPTRDRPACNLPAMKALLHVLWLALACGSAHTTLSKSDAKKSASKTLQEKTQFSETPVQDRGLVVTDPRAEDVVLEHRSYCSARARERHFAGDVLGYVTPWNSHGYDIAKVFGGKFTQISPVWLQLKRRGREMFEVTGLHDVDQGWMRAVRKQAKGLRIVPRLLFEDWTREDFRSVWDSEDEIEELSKTVVQVAKGSRPHAHPHGGGAAPGPAGGHPGHPTSRHPRDRPAGHVHAQGAGAAGPRAGRVQPHDLRLPDRAATGPQRAAVLGASLCPGPGPQIQVAEQDPPGAQLLWHGLLGLQGGPRACRWDQVHPDAEGAPAPDGVGQPGRRALL